MFVTTEQLPFHKLLEVLGGALAAFGASRLPDLFDPPISPNHRDIAHAIVPVGIAVAACRDYVPKSQIQLRSYADSLAAQRAMSHSMSDFEYVTTIVIEVLCRLLTGALIGAPAGYLSHLALDAFTARGLPLVTAGL